MPPPQFSFPGLGLVCCTNQRQLLHLAGKLSPQKCGGHRGLRADSAVANVLGLPKAGPGPPEDSVCCGAGPACEAVGIS